MPSCKQCSTAFEVTDSDRQFYARMQVPEPTVCPDCRQQRHLCQINQVNLLKRKCDATGADIVSNYPPESPFKVYSQKHWFSDQFDGTKYGRDFDFDRPFFEQYQELAKEVPRPCLFTDFLRDENSDYTNYAGLNKNCYLIMDSDESWDCYYSYSINSCKNTMDCYRGDKLELGYENVDCKGCFGSAFLTNSENCSDSFFLRNCIGCKNCIMCSNLQHKEYHVNNKPVSKEEYEKIKASLSSFKVLEHAKKKFDEFRLKFPQKYMVGFQNENCTGNYLVNCKNAVECYDSRSIWDGKYLTQIFMPVKDCMDCDEVGNSELIYNSNNLGYHCYFLRFCFHCLDEVHHSTYCNYCFHSKNLFGCIGLRGKQYCILNKQYSKEEYEALVSKIVAHMTKTGEWGEFFPASTSAFPYNLTLAQDYYPLSREEALAQGYSWRDEDRRDYQVATTKLPDDIKGVPDTLPNETLVCGECGKNYKIIPQELALYRKLNLPVARRCFLCRHRSRMKSRNPRKLYDRKCGQCKTTIQTTYAPERPEIVYCEKCYQESMV